MGVLVRIGKAPTGKGVSAIDQDGKTDGCVMKVQARQRIGQLGNGYPHALLGNQLGNVGNRRVAQSKPLPLYLGCPHTLGDSLTGGVHPQAVVGQGVLLLVAEQAPQADTLLAKIEGALDSLSEKAVLSKFWHNTEQDCGKIFLVRPIYQEKKSPTGRTSWQVA